MEAFYKNKFVAPLGLLPSQVLRLREQVKRNLDRFPSNFMFRLTAKEVKAMISQNSIPSKQQLGGFLPYAFTEHGVLMPASVLKSKQALDVSISVIEIDLCENERNVINR